MTKQEFKSRLFFIEETTRGPEQADIIGEWLTVLAIDGWYLNSVVPIGDVRILIIIGKTVRIPEKKDDGEHEF